MTTGSPTTPTRAPHRGLRQRSAAPHRFPLRRALLVSCASFLSLLSCATEFEPASDVAGLRILAITADRSYARAGEDVAFAMTVTDGLGDDNGDPRALQIMWLGGCFDPPGDLYFLCVEELATRFQGLGAGMPPDPGLLSSSHASPAEDGVPDAHKFTLRIPDDIVTRRPAPASGPHYGIAYVFFAACAGTLAPAPLETLGSDVPEFPLQCLDADGNPQGPESFVPGYTQLYAFADERQNTNPPTEGIELDGVPIARTAEDATVVLRCPISDAERGRASCGSSTPTDVCVSHRVTAIVPDVAEFMPDATDESGQQLRETIWVSYFGDGGDFESGVKLVSDARVGYLADHTVDWLAPEEPGLYQLWAVTRDQRGGSSVVRGFVRVE
ncbi:MAG: hypothetical protein EXR75_10215 [Myxococcales bacterium]|nr:hypothetical protein [Myxococcales bacterium]